MVETSSTTPLQLYWDLSKTDTDTRNNAVHKLYTTLQHAQQQYEQHETDYSDTEQTIDPSIQYAIKRLIKGLSSSRLASRQGYATALTYLLQQFTYITTDNILTLYISTHSNNAAGGTNKQELKDGYMSQIFIWQVLCQCKRINDCSNDTLYKAIKSMLDIATQHSVALNEIIYNTIYCMVEQIPFKQYQHSTIYTLVYDTILKQQLDKLNVYQCKFALQLIQLYGQHISIEKIDAHNSIKYVLEFSNTDYTTQLITSLYSHCIQQQQKLLPHTYIYIVQRLLDINTNNDTGSNIHRFTQFWTDVVDQHCLNSDATAIHKYIGLNITMQLLQYLSNCDIQTSTTYYNSVIEIVLSQNLIECLAYNLANTTVQFHGLSVQLVTQLLDLCKQYNILTPTVIQCIHTYSTQFDAQSHTSTVQQLMSTLNSEQVIQHINKLQSQLHSNVTHTINTLYTLFKSVYMTLTDDTTYIHSIIDTLIQYGYIQQTDVETTAAEQLLCRNRLHSILNDLLQLKSNTENYLQYTVQQLHQQHKQKIELILELSTDTAAVQHTAFKCIKAIDKKLEHNKDTIQSTQLTAFKQLILYQLYTSYSNEQASESLSELCTLYEQAFTNQHNKQYIHVFIDILIQLLSTATDMLRYIIRNVITVYVNELDDVCMDTILAVLTQKPDADESDDDLQPFDESEIPVHSDNDSDSVSDGNSESDSDNETNAVVMNGNHAVDDVEANSDNEITVDFNSIGNILLNTDTNDEYSTALQNVVTLHSEKHNANKELNEQTTHFKYRIIDLIEHMIKLHTNHIVELSLLYKLVQCVATMKQIRTNKVLIQRVITVFDKLCKPKHMLQITDTLTVQHCHTAVEQLSSIITKSDTETVLLAHTAVLYIVRIMYNNNTDDTIQYITKYYTQWLTAYVTHSNTHIQQSIFSDVSERFNAIGLILLPAVSQYTCDVKSVHSLYTYNTLFTMAYDILRHCKQQLFNDTTVLTNVCTLSNTALQTALQHAQQQVVAIENVENNTTQLQSIAKRLCNTLKYIKTLVQYCTKYNNVALIKQMINKKVIKSISSMNTHLSNNANVKHQLQQLSQHSKIQFNAAPTQSEQSTEIKTETLPIIGKKRKLDASVIEQIKQRQKLANVYGNGIVAQNEHNVDNNTE